MTPASKIAVNVVRTLEGAVLENGMVGVSRSQNGRGVDFVFQEVPFDTIDYEQVSDMLCSFTKGFWAHAGGVRAEWRAILRYERMPLRRLAGNRVYEESESDQDKEDEDEVEDE